MSETPSLSPMRVAQLADELATAAQTGLHWSTDPYDRQRYARMLDIAAELLAGTCAVPIETAMHWYTDVPGTLTPKLGAAVAALDTEGRLLLIQRRDNSCWALPGGIVEYGETAATAATREALEESGVRVHAHALLGLYDGRRHGLQAVAHWVTVVFRATVLGGSPGPSNETIAAGFFTRTEADTLPLSPGYDRPIRDAFAPNRGPERIPFFDA